MVGGKNVTGIHSGGERCSLRTMLQSFRRESDKLRHKCLDERQKPVCEQRGAKQCSHCQRWFRSRGGLAVHRCMPEV